MKNEIIKRIEEAETTLQVGKIYKEATELMNKGEISKSDFIEIGQAKDDRMHQLTGVGNTPERNENSDNENASSDGEMGEQIR